jgi:hypothetical protein
MRETKCGAPVFVDSIRKVGRRNEDGEIYCLFLVESSSNAMITTHSRRRRRVFLRFTVAFVSFSTLFLGPMNIFIKSLI